MFTLGSFSFGVVTGVFKTPPYDALNYVHDVLIGHEESQIVPTYENFDISAIIDIQNETDIDTKRQQLIEFVFKNKNEFYDDIPSQIDANIVDQRYSEINNLRQIDKFTIDMEYDVNSISYLFLPKSSNNKLVIYHQGHDGDFINGKMIIENLLNKNYSVLAFSMPLTGQNSNPVIDLDRFGKFKLASHDDLYFLETESFSPLKYFLKPISSSLNYLDKNYNFEHYYMMGISGGGWTTGVYSAIDPRIEKSFPVAGTAPEFLRFNNPKNVADYEQKVPAFFRIANYLEQYVMASYGDNREQLQIFNKQDPCCFSGEQYKIYEGAIQKVLAGLGKGKFSIIIDENNPTHSISPNSLARIIQEMEN